MKFGKGDRRFPFQPAVQAVIGGVFVVFFLFLYSVYSNSSIVLRRTTEIRGLLESRGNLDSCRLELEIARQATEGSTSGSTSLAGGTICESELERARVAAKGLASCQAELDAAKLATSTLDCPPIRRCQNDSTEEKNDAFDKLSTENADLKKMVKRLLKEKAKLEYQINYSPAATSAEKASLSAEAMESARKLLDGCNTNVEAVTANGKNGELKSWKGYKCKATDAEMKRYLDYKPRELCPHDWYFVQRLIFLKECFSLPRRRCLTRTPPSAKKRLSRPESLFDQRALADENVRWDLHQCKSFECLNTRSVGDCRNCFNLTLEQRRWQSSYRGSLSMKQVIDMKAGELRLGLDVGGGTGSFAAHMALYNVTVMTTAFNVETVPGRRAGLPYMETIALRGLIPLHSPHKARLPLYDASLDIIHSVNSVKYLPPLEFEEIIFEWDRVLRAGGILWFEMFYAPVSQMPVYVQIIEFLDYEKLYWNYTPKPDMGEREGDHIYLNCILEKPIRPGKEVLDGPLEEDTKEYM